MADKNFSNESFSVDDILKEVRAMRASGESETPAKKVVPSTPAITPEEVKSGFSGASAAEKPFAVQKADETPKKAVTPKSFEASVVKSAINVDIDALTQSLRAEPAADKKPEPQKQPIQPIQTIQQEPQKQPSSSSARNMITPDEIKDGFSGQVRHVNEKRKPPVMTANEVKSIKINTPDSTGVTVETESSEPENEKLKSFFAKTSESTYVGDKDKAKQQIDALFGDDPNVVLSPLKKKYKSNMNVLSPEEINNSEIKRPEKPKKSVKKQIDAITREEPEHIETKAEMKARLKREREDEKIRRSEQKAAEKIEKHLAKSRAHIDNDPDEIAKVNAEQKDALTENSLAQKNQTPNKNTSKKKLKKQKQQQMSAQKHKDDLFDELKAAEKTEKNANAENAQEKAVQNGAIKPKIKDKPIELNKIDFDNIEVPSATDLDDTDDYIEEYDHRNFRAIRAEKVELDHLPQTPPEKDDVIDDYCTIDDAESVRVGLDAKISAISKRSAFTFVMFVLLGIFTLLPCFGIALPTLVSPEKNVLAFLGINLILFIITIIINGKTIINGLFSLIRLKPDIDTAASLSVVAALVQSVLALSLPQTFADGNGHLFTAVAAAALYFNLRGKKCMFTRVRSNFDLVATTGVKKSCFALKDRHSASITDHHAIGRTTVACSRSVLNLHDYLFNSFCEDPADRMNMILAPIGLIVAVITGGIKFYFSGDIMQAVGCVAAVAAVCVPLTSVLASNRPLKKAGKIISAFGGLLSGYNAVEDFADTEYVVVNDDELFPAGTVDLLSLKAVGNSSIDDVIMDAAALVLQAGGPLADVFDRMIEGRSKNLKKAGSIIYTDGFGISGTVGFDTIAVGNRSMIEKSGDINLPDIEIERKIERNNCFAVYISRNDVLCGMLVVKYNEKDSDLTEQLQRMTQNGVTMLVKTCDPNVTSKLVCSTFSLEANTVEIMPAHSAEEYDELTYPRESGDSVIAHQNSLTGYAAAITAAKRLKMNILIAIILQTVGVVLGFAVVMYISLKGGYADVLPSTLLIYQLICALVTVIVPALRKA